MMDLELSNLKDINRIFQGEAVIVESSKFYTDKFLSVTQRNTGIKRHNEKYMKPWNLPIHVDKKQCLI